MFFVLSRAWDKEKNSIRNRTSDLRIPRSDALPLSHRDSTVGERNREMEIENARDKARNIFPQSFCCCWFEVCRFLIWNDHCCIKTTVPDTFVTFYFLFLCSNNVSGVTCADWWSNTWMPRKCKCKLWYSLSVFVQQWLQRLWFSRKKMSTRWNLEWTRVYLSK